LFVAGDQSTVTVNVYAGSSVSGTPVQVLTATRDATTGAFTVGASSALADGIYTVQAVQSDAAGNIGTSMPCTFTIDTVPPVVTLATPAEAPDGSVNFSGTGGLQAGDSSTVTVNIFDSTGQLVLTLTATIDPTTGAYSVNTSALVAGNYTASAQQTDDAGNTGTSGLVSFSVT
jgi:hypothetical protein